MFSFIWGFSFFRDFGCSERGGRGINILVNRLSEVCYGLNCVF